MEEIKLIVNGTISTFLYKGIRIDVDQYTILQIPNKLGGKYCIVDAKIKEAYVHVNGQILKPSIIEHFVIEEAVKDLDNKSFGKSSPHPSWNVL